MVLIKVDLPRPVWPKAHRRVNAVRLSRASSRPRQSRLTDADDVELEPALQELALDLRGDAVETDVALGVDGGSGHGSHRVGRC